MSVLEAGTKAPSFTLARSDGGTFTEEDLLGRTTVLVFYPFAFSAVCTDQFQHYEPLVAELAGRGGVLVGVSCDATYSQSAFKDKLGVTSEQLSDFQPKGADMRRVRRPSPRRLRRAGADHHRPRRGRALELSGGLSGRAAERRAAALGHRGGVRREPLSGRCGGRSRPPVRVGRATSPALSSLRSDIEKKETDRRPTGGTGRQ